MSVYQTELWLPEYAVAALVGGVAEMHIAVNTARLERDAEQDGERGLHAVVSVVRAEGERWLPSAWMVRRAVLLVRGDSQGMVGPIPTDRPLSLPPSARELEGRG